MYTVELSDTDLITLAYLAGTLAATQSGMSVDTLNILRRAVVSETPEVDDVSVEYPKGTDREVDPMFVPPARPRYGYEAGAGPVGNIG